MRRGTAKPVDDPATGLCLFFGASTLATVGATGLGFTLGLDRAECGGGGVGDVLPVDLSIDAALSIAVRPVCIHLYGAIGAVGEARTKLFDNFAGVIVGNPNLDSHSSVTFSACTMRGPDEWLPILNFSHTLAEGDVEIELFESVLLAVL